MEMPSRAGDSDVGAPGELTQYANRTLDFLNIIEKTLRSVTQEVDLIQTLARGCERYTKKIREMSPARELDPTGRVSELLILAAASAERSYDEAILRRNSARADKSLNVDDGVVECFEGLVAALADFHNGIDELRDAVEMHDALLSPVTGTHTDVEELIAALKG